MPGRRRRAAPEPDPAAGRDPGRDRHKQQGQDVVDDRGTQDDAGRTGADQPEVDHRGRGDADAGRSQCGSDEDARLRALAERQREADSAGEGQHHAGHADPESGCADRSHLGDPRLQPDPEEQEDHTQLGEHLEHLACLHQAEHGGPDEDSGENLADDRRLADPLEDLVAELRRKEHQEEVGEDTRGVPGSSQWEVGKVDQQAGA